MRDVGYYCMIRFFGENDERVRESSRRHDGIPAPINPDHVSHHIFFVRTVALVLERGDELFHFMDFMHIIVVGNSRALV